MYSLALFLASSQLSLSTVYSSTLPSPVSSSLNLQARITNDSSTQNLTAPPPVFAPHCSIYLGQSLNYESCSDALAKISRGTTPMVFGQRNTGVWDVILPRRYLSGRSLVKLREGIGEGQLTKVFGVDDGQCAIDVKAEDSGQRRDISNYLQLTQAASTVLRTCVDVRLANSGGYVKFLGTI